MCKREWKWMFVFAVVGLLVASLAGLTNAQESEKPKKVEATTDSKSEKADETKKKKKEPLRLTVAVLDFDTKAPGNEQLGGEIADLLTGLLSASDKLLLVERARMKKMLEEAELSLSGIVSADKAIKIGHLVGAQLLVVGRVFPVGKNMYFVAKVISTETSLVKACIVRAKLADELGPSVEKLAAKVQKIVEKDGPKMVAATPPDRADTLAKALKGVRLPKVSIVIPEMHIGRQVIDPAGETEFAFMLKEAGFKILDPDSEGISKWAKVFFSKKPDAKIPPELSSVDVVIVGEAFSEFAMRKGNLISCKARLEVQAIDTATGEVLAVGRENTVQVDLAENIAGKRAIQKAAARVAVKFIPQMVKNWNKAHPKSKESKEN
ncbi:MAG: CsgG/HfaB family protein [Planctomycetia bacterium]|nr:CsgG/HfaB family protein [Planctomycetia bacterium]